jgi:hypothetical protein
MRAAPATCVESAENDANAGNVDAASAEGGSSQPAAFAQYRFVEEDGRAVLYIYELQLAAAARRKGVGKYLTQVRPLIDIGRVGVCVCVSLPLSDQAERAGSSALQQGAALGPWSGGVPNTVCRHSWRWFARRCVVQSSNSPGGEVVGRWTCHEE